VHTGQRVSAGDIIGLVGKTGNAQHTVPHLHFGIYTNEGAIDPLAFIDTTHTDPKPVSTSTKQLNKWLRTTASSPIYEGPSSSSSIQFRTSPGETVLLLAATGSWYKIQLPNGEGGYIAGNLLTDKILRRHKITDEKRLLDAPDANAPAKAIIAKGISVDVIGSYNNFYLVTDNKEEGWVME
jgi:uncharacterized protein YgiM (DUF1202 family)